MKTFFLAAILVPLSASIGNAQEAKEAVSDVKMKPVKARSLELKIPESWTEAKTNSSMRVAQYVVPGKPSEGEFVVFYFGGPTGGTKANVERWIGQFEEEGLKLQMFEGECAAGSYILVDTQGTWKKPDGPPMARKTVATPNSRVLNVIVEETKGDSKDYYFLKLTGHEDLISKQTKVLRKAIGAKMDSEKEFKLD
ncbi:MAG: hypothetical protein AB8B50_05370 [Pirellulaceae bacterium]